MEAFITTPIRHTFCGGNCLINIKLSSPKLRSCDHLPTEKYPSIWFFFDILELCPFNTRDRNNHILITT